MRINCFVILCLMLLCAEAYATGKRPGVEKVPAWVSATTVNYTAEKFDDEAEDGFSNLHYEKQVSLQQQAAFQKRAVHILSEAGVQNHSQISIDYDPAYQSLIFHTVYVIRAGKTIDKLQLSKIETIQQEKDLDKNLYNGTLTAILILDDVRKGDIIEYSYTIKGFNPIFKNKYSALLEIGFGVPVYSFYYRLLVPKTRHLNFKNSLTDVQPSVSANGNETSYVWTISDVAGIDVEDNTPSWYDPYPMVIVSEFDSWKDVADWASELFPVSPQLSDGLKKKIEEIKAANTTLEAQVLATIRFVQDEVRYMGIEMGVNSHKPHSPSQVFAQRFGDCKDKTYLLCTMLKALGVEASPVLNNTYFKKTIANWLPMPTIFNHVTVCMQWKGKSIWIDPTISYQRGSLADISYPNYQTGLIVQPGTQDLAIIPLQESGKIASKEIFFVKSMHGAVKLEVLTNYSGTFADDTRYSFHTNSLSEIKKQYKSFYAEYFEGLAIDSLTYSDNEETGVFSTKEYYTLKNFWTEKDGKVTVALQPYLVSNALKSPAKDRSMPYALTYPLRYQEEIEVHLPKEWDIEEFSTAFKNTSFSLNFQYTHPEENIVLLTYHFENLADHIAPDKIDTYLKDIAKSDEYSGFELSSSGNERVDSALESSWNKGFTAAYVLIGICTLATYFYRKRNV